MIVIFLNIILKLNNAEKKNILKTHCTNTQYTDSK